MTNSIGFERILVATDFSPHAEAALQQAIWLAGPTGARITLIHVLPDIGKALLAATETAQQDAILGEGEKFQHEVRRESTERMQFLITKLNAQGLGIRCETLLGDPSLAIIHEVQQGQHDIVLVGTRNQTAWERFTIGSTAKRLIRKCPVPVWAVSATSQRPPKVVLASTDFSEVSLNAVRLARKVARQANADFHLLHIIDSQDIPVGVIERLSPNNTLRDEMLATSQRKLAEFVDTLDGNPEPVHSHIFWGIPAQDIARLAKELKADLLVLGCVGRSGIKGVLLGNTAERLLNSCECSVLTTKPADFVCPVAPAFWPLHESS